MSDQPTRIDPRRVPATSLRTVRVGLPMRETEHLIRTLLAAGHSPDGVTGAVCEWIEAIRSRGGYQEWIRKNYEERR